MKSLLADIRNETLRPWKLATLAIGMGLLFAGAYLTAESERWRLLHVTLGYTMAGLVGFRIFWGLVGTRYARFSSFLRGPQAIARYLKSLVSGKPEHHTGHNPAGALAILEFLALTAFFHSKRRPTTTAGAMNCSVASIWFGSRQPTE